VYRQVAGREHPARCLKRVLRGSVAVGGRSLFGARQSWASGFKLHWEAVGRGWCPSQKGSGAEAVCMECYLLKHELPYWEDGISLTDWELGMLLCYLSIPLQTSIASAPYRWCGSKTTSLSLLPYLGATEGTSPFSYPFTYLYLCSLPVGYEILTASSTGD
jgi:hypothetical protein